MTTDDHGGVVASGNGSTVCEKRFASSKLSGKRDSSEYEP